MYKEVIVESCMFFECTHIDFSSLSPLFFHTLPHCQYFYVAVSVRPPIHPLTYSQGHRGRWTLTHGHTHTHTLDSHSHSLSSTLGAGRTCTLVTSLKKTITSEEH